MNGITKPFLLCVDSDGTIMDTMTVKHQNCFAPEIIKIFQITKGADEIYAEWQRLNLYSSTRGINRFAGLLAILEYAQETFHYVFPGFITYRFWVNTTSELSLPSLQKEMAKFPTNDCLKKAYEWSCAVNQAIEKLPPSSTFEGVKEMLERIHQTCTLWGVSSANLSAVEEEWKRNDIFSLFDFVACQNFGTKEKILEEALNRGYQKHRILMVGDAMGDYQAAKQKGISFFPILPQQEIQSWKQLVKEAIPIWLEENYCEEYQCQVLHAFYKCLNA